MADENESSPSFEIIYWWMVASFCMQLNPCSRPFFCLVTLLHVLSVDVFPFGFGTVNLGLFNFPVHCVVLRAFNLVAQMYIRQSEQHDVKEVDVVWFKNFLWCWALSYWWKSNSRLLAWMAVFGWVLKPLTPNDYYSGRTAPLTSKCCIVYIYSTNTGTEYFKHGIYSPFFPLQNAVCFIILTYFVHLLFTCYIQGVLKFKKIILVPKG